MKVGMPKGLLYSKYHAYLETFFFEMGAEIISSPETNRNILNEGVKLCVDDACLPVKVFHGHVACLRGKCDAIFIPRFISVRDKEFICPKFCGLTEMVANSIPDLPPLIGEPMYWTHIKDRFIWAQKAGSYIKKNKRTIKNAFEKAESAQNMNENKCGYNQEGYRQTVALLGHPYNIYDELLNMNLIRKLNKLNVGIITDEYVDDNLKDQEIRRLFKRPFWTFARDSYGAAVNLCRNRKIDGIIYVSSFACGIDSVVIELIKDETRELPFLVLKIDEHTGEAGFDTRIEAFVDMLKRDKRYSQSDITERSISIAGDHTAYGQCIPGGQGFI